MRHLILLALLVLAVSTTSCGKSKHETEASSVPLTVVRQAYVVADDEETSVFGVSSKTDADAFAVAVRNHDKDATAAIAKRGTLIPSRVHVEVLEDGPFWSLVRLPDGKVLHAPRPNVVETLPAPAPVRTPSKGSVAGEKSPTEVTKFVVWAIEHRAKAVKVTSEPTCKGDGWCSGFCKGFQSETAFCRVRYWKAEPQAVSFDLGMVPGPLMCADLAGNATERARTSQDVGCSLASGMLALINLRGDKMNSVFVVTPEYRARDRDMVLP
ncbi:MAG: hypothetical protein ABI134_15890 [Byssovorax sp.]